MKKSHFQENGFFRESRIKETLIQSQSPILQEFLYIARYSRQAIPRYA